MPTTGERFIRTAADGQIALGNLVTGESATPLQVSIYVVEGRLKIGADGAAAFEVPPGQMFTLDFAAATPPNATLFFLVEGSERCIFYVYTYGA